MENKFGIEGTNINLENPKEVVKFIKELGNQNRTMINESGNTVVALVTEFGSLELRTNQDNGWVRLNWYGEEGNYEGESYDGRWK